MSEIKQYDTEVRLEAVMGTNYYGVHIHAMTAEDLHSKSGIAVELAWRDLRIEQLIAQLEAAQKEITDWRSVAEAAAQDDADWHKLADRNTDLICKMMNVLITTGERANKAEAALSAANERLSKPVSIWKLNNFREAPVGGIEWAKGYMVANNRAVKAIHDAGFTVEGY